MIFQLPKIDSVPSPWLMCHPNIPNPMHGMNPRTIMGKNWWDIERQKAYAKFDYHCWCCGVHKKEAKKHRWLEGHENYIIDYKSGTLKLKEVVALCHYCHMGIHDGFLNIKFNDGLITEQEYNDILAHKELLLSRFNCDLYYSGPEGMAAWDEWKLIISGIKFKPKFKSFEEWRTHYNPSSLINMDYEEAGLNQYDIM